MITPRKLLMTALLVFALPATASTTAFINATIYTADKAGVITNGTLVMRESRIVSVGSGAPPAGATIIDARGKTLTPGMFAPLSSLGVSEIDGVRETNDSGSGHGRYSASIDMADAFNPLSLRIPIARVDGVTRAMVSPQSRPGGSVIVGQGAVVSLGTDAEWMVKPRAAMFAEFGEGGASLSGTRATAAQAIREAFAEVRNARAKVTREPNLDSLLSSADIAALRPVLAGQTPLVVHADRASDIVAALKLAKQNKLRLVIAGGSEAWLVARQLADAKVAVILDPQLQLPNSFESMGARRDNARLLHEAGVTVAFSSDKTASYNARILRQLAGIAINSGLDPQAALAAITLHPARLYGVGKDLGSLAAGKLADVVMWDGDPFELSSHPEAVFISGTRMDTSTRQSALRDKYMRMHRLK
ncbi:amidohydrolase family protein [Massilia sp. PAMC28688]|uniref:amidohydrolase family protein n=1 Tax=Massilia sp. PAMC28688 TaxID=2861283 RepID=UPI001C631AD9|nr:amidohydrolase family protein [Massilia sp. PAMC28688]QYF94454.1 amidohydrolase family protein [Massilia sp. PAMC28688]